MVGIGGFAGSALRYAISRAMLPLAAMSHFPWHSLLVNVVGSLLIGALVACRLTGHWYYLAVIGFCGGFATFSMFSLEMFKMIRLGYTSGAILCPGGQHCAVPAGRGRRFFPDYEIQLNIIQSHGIC